MSVGVVVHFDWSAGVTQAEAKRRKVVFATPYFPPEGGGLERYAFKIARCLERRHSWEVVVVTSGSQRWGVLEDVYDGIRIYRLPHQARISNTRIGITWRRDLKEIIAAEQPDVINAHAPVPGLADAATSIAGAIPVIVTYHASSMRKGEWPFDLLVAFYEETLCQRMLSRSAWVICTSDYVRNSYLGRFRAKCSTVAPAVDAALFVPAPRLGRNRVVFVGGLTRGHRSKGLASLLLAFSGLVADRPDVRLDVVGAGDDMDRYRSICRDLRIAHCVDFRGQLEGEALVAAYQSAAVFALPTTNEAFGMVVLEAMSCGVPVVSTLVGGVPHLVADGRQGFLVDPGDVAGLAKKIARLLDNYEEASRMGRAGREAVEALYTWELQGDRTNAIFEAAIEAAIAGKVRG